MEENNEEQQPRSHHSSGNTLSEEQVKSLTSEFTKTIATQVREAVQREMGVFKVPAIPKHKANTVSLKPTPPGGAIQTSQTPVLSGHPPSLMSLQVPAPPPIVPPFGSRPSPLERMEVSYDIGDPSHGFGYDREELVERDARLAEPQEEERIDSDYVQTLSFLDQFVQQRPEFYLPFGATTSQTFQTNLRKAEVKVRTTPPLSPCAQFIEKRIENELRGFHAPKNPVVPPRDGNWSAQDILTLPVEKGKTVKGALSVPSVVSRDRSLVCSTRTYPIAHRPDTKDQLDSLYGYYKDLKGNAKLEYGRHLDSFRELDLASRAMSFAALGFDALSNEILNLKPELKPIVLSVSKGIQHGLVHSIVNKAPFSQITRQRASTPVLFLS